MQSIDRLINEPIYTCRVSKQRQTNEKLFSESLVGICMVDLAVFAKLLNWNRFNGDKFAGANHI